MSKEESIKEVTIESLSLELRDTRDLITETLALLTSQQVELTRISIAIDNNAFILGALVGCLDDKAPLMAEMERMDKELRTRSESKLPEAKRKPLQKDGSGNN